MWMLLCVGVEVDLFEPVSQLLGRRLNIDAGGIEGTVTKQRGNTNQIVCMRC